MNEMLASQMSKRARMPGRVSAWTLPRLRGRISI